MIRIIVCNADHNVAAHVGGPVHVQYRTFEIDAPEVERYLASAPQYIERSVVGVEVPAQKESDDHG